MKLRAIRVKEVGCFREPVAIEGLSGGFDVLAGRNEAGKSTLFRALETLFREKYSTESQKLRAAITPYGGGAPLIEAEFEIGGQFWRYRKQFFAGRMAELRSVSTGTLLRNADAETRMAELLGGTAGIELLWVRQRDALDPLPPSADGRSLILASISREVTVAAGGQAAAVVRAKVADELGELVTASRGNPKGAYKAAREALAAHEHALTEADARAAAAETHLSALARLRDEVALLSAPATAAARQEMLERIDRQLAADDALAGELAAVTERRDHFSAQAERAEELALRAELQFTEAARLDVELDEATARSAALAETLATLIVNADAAKATYAAARTEAQRLSRRIEDGARAAEAQRRQALVVAAETTDMERQALAKAMEDNAATQLLASRIEAEHRAIEILKERAAANAPAVEVMLGTSGRGRLLVDGAPLAHDQTYHPVAPLTLAVPGLATIRVSPAAGDSIKDITADLDAHQQMLAALLAVAGARDLAEARQRAGERNAIELALASLEARLAALVPEGLAPARLALEGFGPPAATMDTEADIGQLPARHGAAVEEVARREIETGQALAAVTAASTAKAVEEARIAEQDRRRKSLAGELPPEADRAAHLAALKAQAASAKTNVSDIAEAANLIGRRRLPAAERQHRLAERNEIAAEAARAEQRIREAALEAAHLGGLIESDAEAASGPERDRLAGEREHYRRIVQRHEAEIAGLNLLGEMLAAIAEAGTSSYLQPILERIRPQLASLLQAEELGFSPELGFTGIIRGGRQELDQQLSTGTREQIAVLVRLGFGDILALGGHPIPIVLDDALVYSDDERLVNMLAILKIASVKQQVILLSCRTRVMATQGYAPLELRPWRTE